MTSKVVAQFEDRKQDIIVKDFGGVNLSAHRSAIAQDEFAWLENLIPMGPANLVVTPGAGANIALSNVTFMAYANVGGDLLVVVQQSGALSAIALSTGTITGFVNGVSPTSVAIAQWKNERIIVVDATNYRSVGSQDGLVFFNGWVVAVTVTLGGAGYTSIPTVAFSGGGGLGATAIALMQLNGAQAVAAGGTGYTVGDILSLVGGGNLVTAQVRVETLGAGNSVATVSIYNSGLYSLVLPTPPVATTGGAGTGATITPLYNVASVTVTRGATVAYTTAPSVAINGGGFSLQATATATILSGPVGTTVASFAGRVWVGNFRTVSYSAPDSWFDFTATNAGGSFVISDETLEANVNQLVPANGFLYIVGNTSIDTLSNVTVVAGSPPVTNFSRVNISAQIGSPSGPTNPLIIFGKSLLFSNKITGIYSVLGSTPQKISKKLDLLFKAITKGGSAIGAGVTKIYGVICPVFLISYPDGSLGGTRTLFVALYEGKWFFATQGTPTLMCGATLNGEERIYATDGTNVYQVFGDATNSATIAWKAITALWPAKNPTVDKQVLKCAVEFSPLDNAVVSVPVATTDANILINVDLENERGALVSAVVLSNVGQWVNASGVVGSWVNASGQVGDWLVPGFNVQQGDAEIKGKYIGYTLHGSTKGFTINGILGQYEDRAKWNASGVS